MTKTTETKSTSLATLRKTIEENSIINRLFCIFNNNPEYLLKALGITSANEPTYSVLKERLATADLLELTVEDKEIISGYLNDIIENKLNTLKRNPGTNAKINIIINRVHDKVKEDSDFAAIVASFMDDSAFEEIAETASMEKTDINFSKLIVWCLCRSVLVPIVPIMSTDEKPKNDSQKSKEEKVPVVKGEIVTETPNDVKSKPKTTVCDGEGGAETVASSAYTTSTGKGKSKPKSEKEDISGDRLPVVVPSRVTAADVKKQIQELADLFRENRIKAKDKYATLRKVFLKVLSDAIAKSDEKAMSELLDVVCYTVDVFKVGENLIKGFNRTIENHPYAYKLKEIAYVCTVGDFNTQYSEDACSRYQTCDKTTFNALAEAVLGNQIIKDCDLYDIETAYGGYYGVYDKLKLHNANMLLSVVIASYDAKSTVLKHHITNGGIGTVKAFIEMYMGALDTMFDNRVLDTVIKSNRGIIHRCIAAYVDKISDEIDCAPKPYGPMGVIARLSQLFSETMSEALEKM